jgi:hypothetical protein
MNIVVHYEAEAFRLSPKDLSFSASRRALVNPLSYPAPETAATRISNHRATQGIRTARASRMGAQLSQAVCENLFRFPWHDSASGSAIRTFEDVLGN